MMTTTATLVISALAALNGCCSGCDLRVGTYNIKIVETNGNCGPVPDNTLRIDQEISEPPPGCTWTIDNSNDNCHVEFESFCDVPNSDLTLHEVGAADWDCDAGAGEAVVTAALVDPDGLVQCRSTYDYSYEKL